MSKRHQQTRRKHYAPRAHQVAELQHGAERRNPTRDELLAMPLAEFEAWLEEIGHAQSVRDAIANSDARRAAEAGEG